MSKGDELIAFARSKIGQFYYTNDWWARMNPDESGGTDCSGFVRYCYLQFGLDVGTWTGDESQAGFEIARGHYPWEIPWDAMKPGDLILMTANYWDNYDFSEYLCHIELYCGGGTMIGHPGGYGPQEKWAQAWMDAYGCITWMVRRVFDDDVRKPEQVPGEPVNDSGMWYRMHVQDLGWLEPVRDGQTAGTTGWALRGEALKISPPEGMKLNVQAHIQDVGWTEYEVGNGQDPVMGTTGEAKRLECICIRVNENPNGLKVRYRVHIQDFGWTGWVDEGFACGTVGCGKAIEALQIEAL